MSSLFPIEYIFPPGFIYEENFLTPEEEQKLLILVSTIERHNMMFQGFEAKRKTASFGYDYNFDKRTISKGKCIPVEFNPLIEKVGHKFSISPNEFSELLLTEYPVGSVINWHRDAPPFDIIVGISLNADCTFRLRPHDKARRSRSSIISFPLHQRSLYLMTGEARTDWQHSIAPVKKTRFSITLRTLK
jgi:alkylated DNA repair dioxygenase AlkB